MKFPDLKEDNSISEKVYQTIYKQIILGKIAPGDRITELEIAGSMGISRPPVREALKRLAEDKLVILVPRSGCFIADLKPEEIEEIYEIRKRLESMALEYAFNKMDRALLKKIKQNFNDCKKLSSASLVKSETKLDSQFHKLIAEKSGCQNLREMLDKLRARVEVFRIREANHIKRAKDALQEHVRILNSILSNNKTKAIKELGNHIEHTKKNVLTNLKNSK